MAKADDYSIFGQARKSRTEDFSGRTFGNLTVISFMGYDKRGALWLCKCSCGNESAVRAFNLKLGKTQSCGCIQSFLRKTGALQFDHGRTRTREYRIWSSMKTRCLNPSAINYSRYGGRGIKICERWQQSFQFFLDDMGLAPTNAHSIERNENSGHYEPGNCRWATLVEQGRNKRNNRMVNVGGREMVFSEACEAAGISNSSVRSRLTRGWTMEKALGTPVRKFQANVVRS